MSRAMEILKMEPEYTARKKSAPQSSKIKALMGLASIAAVAVLGSTLAANISLGSGTLEFGQGVQVTAACDSSITLTPKVNFVNSAGGGTFFLSTIGFSNLDASSSTTCQGKTLTLSAYGDSGASPIQIATSPTSTAITAATVGITATTPTSSAGTVIANTGTNASQTYSFDLGFTTPSATSGAVYKLTLQSN
jgi:hypothetical protein